MFKRMSHPVIAAGLTAVLALGAVGCSTSSTTTTEVSTTDENGNTTTETTTTTTDSEGNTTTETEATTTDAEGTKMGKDATASDAPSASVSFTGYVNKYYKFGFALPDGFSKTNRTLTMPEGIEVDYQAANADDTARALFFLVQGVTEEEGITDIDSWSKSYTEAFVSSLKDGGNTNVRATYGTFDIAGTNYGKAAVVDYNESERSGLCYILDKDGDGMIIQFTAPDEATFEKIEASFIALQ